MKYQSKLENHEIQKYMRQIILPQITIDGQLKFRNSRVFILGLGGLGSPVLMYLASAGIGKIGIMDYDNVEMHNLQRQVLYNEKVIFNSKVKSAAQFARLLNSKIEIVEYNAFLSETNVAEIIHNYDIIVDCSDNIKVRYLLSDHCKVNGKTLVAASVLKWEGQIFNLMVGGPCYRCLFPEMKEFTQNCDEAGVVGPVCGIIGSMQATEVLKHILGLGKPNFIVYDAFKNEMNIFDIERKPCNVCLERKVVEKKYMLNAPARLEKVKNLLSWKEFYKNEERYLLVDIRPKIMFDICSIVNSINIPKEEIEKDPGIIKKQKKRVVLLCNKGVSAGKLANYLIKLGLCPYVIDGGLRKFKLEVDTNFPVEID